MDKQNNMPNEGDEKEIDYAGNSGTEMPQRETDPEIIRNPDIGENDEEQDRNDQRPTPGTL